MKLFVISFLVGWASLCVHSLQADDAPATRKKPNLILIMADEKNNLAPQLPDFVSKTHVFFEVCAKLV